MTKLGNASTDREFGGVPMRLQPRSFGYHFDPESTQRAIGRHVYIFRPCANGLTVWRLDLADEAHGYRWTLVHDLRHH